ncbi:unnamed protein product, partial [Larinioides sclopetarius]
MDFAILNHGQTMKTAINWNKGINHMMVHEEIFSRKNVLNDSVWPVTDNCLLKSFADWGMTERVIKYWKTYLFTDKYWPMDGFP